MKVAHLILTHNQPRHVERLIKQLLYADDAIFIHVDKKADLSSYHSLKSYRNVFFINNRVAVDWGSYNVVEATLNSFQEMLHASGQYQYFNLVSGADYALQTAGTIHQFLEAHPGKAFMSYQLINEEWPEAIPRITEYHFNNYRFPGKYLLQKIMNKVLAKRTMPNGLIPVGRSQWFTISTNCVQYILEYWAAHPALRRFTKLTWAPDEFIFQTILYNSEYRKVMVNDNLRYIDWSEGKASPKTFTLKDKNQLIASDKFYARKFDLENCGAILDYLDQKLALVTN
ncbi:glycosyl transferase [Adhaeribacter arboris]|uniref:Peptide O-xylosyltransferase n=1 Tax=Adhaeribacter arboris TaxID=2072846 RepID=A0A2T2YMX4_9BACT|nr:beta-1,6-N-acetylglucosaminyltransferase [Adhaeribacter arboris]PSR56851.1 glycosyl transferase [Adhaeribacter arboris]